MRTFLWQHRWKLTWASLPFSLATLALLWTGHDNVATPMLAIMLVVTVTSAIVDRRCKPPPPVLSDDEKASIRDVRDSADEVTAVRMLRTAHPDLGILEAAVMVRAL